MKSHIDILEKPFATSLYELANDMVYGRSPIPVRFWTNKMWQESIVKDSAPVICFQLPDELAYTLQHQLEKAGIFKSDLHQPLASSHSAMIYIWTTGSYIPEHSDNIYSKAITIYLNEYWSAMNGGIFQWFDNKNNAWIDIVPKFNHAVENTDGSMHRTTKVLSSDYRYTVQIFLKQLQSI